MHAGQLSELLAAINRNTDAQIEMAKAIREQGQEQAAAVHRLADECVTLATMLADIDPEDAPPQVDMAGRAIT